MGYNTKIFDIWDSVGKVSYETSKYLGFKFSTMDEYYEAVAEYYGKDVSELNQYMVDFCNDYIQNNQVCGGDIRLVSITPQFNTSREADMEIIYNKMSGIHAVKIEFIKDPTFECPDEDEYGDCYDYECVMSVIRRMEFEFRKKFGLRLGSFSAREVGSFA